MTKEIRVKDGGFVINLSNGWTVSIQIGPARYADNYNASPFDKEPVGGWESSNAEISAWRTDSDTDDSHDRKYYDDAICCDGLCDHDYDAEYHMVRGWQTVDQVMEFIDTIKGL